jgi:hypothetical protein
VTCAHNICSEPSKGQDLATTPLSSTDESQSLEENKP